MRGKRKLPAIFSGWVQSRHCVTSAEFYWPKQGSRPAQGEGKWIAFLMGGEACKKRRRGFVDSYLWS